VIKRKSLLDILKGIKQEECCVNFCRDWRETRGGLPASNHSPMCPNYKTETFFRVVAKGTKGPSCILETQAEVDDLCETPDEYDVTTIEMTRDQFERLEEFVGF
jgi:hypothetical protein